MNLTITTRPQLERIITKMRGHCRSRSQALWRLGCPFRTALRWTVNGRELMARWERGQVRFHVDGERVAVNRLGDHLLTGAGRQTGP